MNLTNLSDEILLINTKKAVKDERESLTKVLHHLKEVDRRRLFSKLRCSSLYDYAMNQLGYSDSEAARRIAAMRLMKSLPQLEEKIRLGKINLTNLNMAQTLFRKEANIEGELAAEKNIERVSGNPQARFRSSGFSPEKKLEILERLENKSTRDAVKIVQEYSTTPLPMVTERVRPVGKDVFEVKFAVSEEVQTKITLLKGLLAHSDPNVSLSDLFNKLCDLGIQTWDPGKKVVRTKQSPSALQVLSDTKSNGEVAVPDNKGDNNQRQGIQFPKGISAETKRVVWKRDHSKCQNCGSTFALQIDHQQPKALGGTNELSNLRLLCRACNQRAAVEVYGTRQMNLYLERVDL